MHFSISVDLYENDNYVCVDVCVYFSVWFFIFLFAILSIQLAYKVGDRQH